MKPRVKTAVFIFLPPVIGCVAVLRRELFADPWIGVANLLAIGAIAFLWALVGLFIRRPLFLAGLVGIHLATTAFVALVIFIHLDAMAWVFYWPLQLIGLFSCVALSRSVRMTKQKPAMPPDQAAAHIATDKSRIEDAHS